MKFKIATNDYLNKQACKNPDKVNQLRILKEEKEPTEKILSSFENIILCFINLTTENKVII